MNPYQKIIDTVAPQHTYNYVMEALEFFSFTLLNDKDSIPGSESYTEEFTEIADAINKKHTELLDEALAKADSEIQNIPFGDENQNEVPWDIIERDSIERLEE